VNNSDIKAGLRRLIEDYRKMDKDVNEANIEATLVSRLFDLLGWDKDNPRVYNRQAYVRGAGYADVGLQIEDDPVIFMEVKKFGKIQTNRIDPQVQTTLPFKELSEFIDRTPEEKQAFKYARSKGIPWAILTNFECLFLFNADQERMILSFKSPEEYLSTKFDDLLRLSKENVKAKSLEWLQDQIKKEEIDKNFLEKLKNWRLSLAQNIYTENKENHILKDEKGEFDFEKLMHIVQRVLSRLLIIQISDDREVLRTHGLLEGLFKSYEDTGDYAKKDYLLSRFVDLSHKMDEHHNTTIFAPEHYCEKVFISNIVFAKILKELCHHSFRKMTADILGATYESYLGYKFALKNGKIEAEIDQRVRKQSGIYYTPAYIVHYIVDNTLGVKLKELEDKFGLEAGEKAKNLKILDPACGSGSFLIYTFDLLANFYEKINEKITQEQLRLSTELSNPDIFENREKFKHLPKKVVDYPKRILENHLYGVDLDPAAAEIATINLVIKAFEKMKGKKLPLILNQNIKVGNSLITGVRKKEELERFKEEISKHIDLRKKLEETEDEKEKGEIIEEINKLREKVNSSLNESLKEYFENPEDKRPFNWEFEFPDIFSNGKPEVVKGFDVVIGNPPWIESKKMVLDEKEYYDTKYFSMKKQYDIFNGFTEQGIRNLKENNVLSFIIPSRFLMNPDYMLFREHLVRNTEISQIVDVGEHIFPNVEMPALILVLRKQLKELKCKNNTIVVRTNIQNLSEGEWREYKIPQERFLLEDKYLFSIYYPEEKKEILKKLEDTSEHLSEFVDNARGVEIGKRSKLISCKREDKSYVRFLVGEDIDRYVILSHRYLKTGVRDIDYKPPDLYKGEKLLVRKTGTGINSTYDNSGTYAIQVIYIFKLKRYVKINLKYVLGLLNSYLLSFYYFSKFGEKTKKTFPHLRQESVLALPIRKINLSVKRDKTKHDQLVESVANILTKNEQSNELAKIFVQTLKNYTHELQSFGKSYYEKVEYVEKIEKKASEIANSKNEISKISIVEGDNLLLFIVFFGDKDLGALWLKIEDENLRLFLFYSIRQYLEENKRRRKWNTKSFPKVLDVILGRLEVPIFRTKANLYNVEHNLKMIDLVMKEFKVKFHKKFPKGNIHLSQIEQEIQETDNKIDALVFKLYGLNKEEVVTVLDSMETPEKIKKDIFKKFTSLK